MIVEERPEKEGTERISVRTRQREQQVQRPWGGGLWGCTRGAERGLLQLEWRESAEERWEVRSEMLAGARSQRTLEKFRCHSENSAQRAIPECWFAGEGPVIAYALKRPPGEFSTMVQWLGF